MQQVNDFTNFLTDHVNLPESKLRHLDQRVDRIYKALRGTELGTRVLGMKKQGSWAQRTIINPKEDEEFDADFMVQLEEQDDWAPSDYQKPVYDALVDYCEAQGIAEDPEAKNRCVRVTYANDMHVDVVPYVDLAEEGECIVNADTDEWEDTDPAGFTDWMRAQDDIANGNLRTVLRLVKYLRDHRGYFSGSKSIILTTVVGNVITLQTLRDDPGCYNNVPRTLRRVTADLTRWVENQVARPEVNDPSRADATFTHRWPQAEYDTFRQDIQDVAALVKDAFNCTTSFSESTKKWRYLFGDHFGYVSSETDSAFPSTGAGAAVGVETVTAHSGRAG